jgi:hypothetical protein
LPIENDLRQQGILDAVVITLRVMIFMHSWASSAVEQRWFVRAAGGTIDRSCALRPGALSVI